MADNVGYSTGTGVSIAADEVGGAYYQRVKVVVGADGTVSGDVGPTNGMPVTGAVGVSGTVSVLGTVSVSGAVPVSGTVTIVPTTLTVNTAATIAGASVTVQQGISVSAVVSGTVTITPTTFTVNTAGTVAGASITIQQGASVSAVVSGTVSLANLPTVTVAPSLSATGAVVWLAGGQSTSVYPVYVSQINPPAGGGGSVTTAVPNVTATGQMIWVVGGQSTTAFPVVITGTVTAGAGTTVVSGTVTVNTAATVAGASVTIQQGASVSAVVSGTVTAIMPGSTTGSSGMSGVLVWLGASQTVLVSTQVSGTVSVSGTALFSVVAGASISIMNVLNTVVTVLGTQVVTVVPGLSVSAIVSGTVSVSGLSVTAAGPSVAAPGIVVWLAGGQSSTAWPVVITGTVTAGAGTTVVSGTVSVSAVGLWTSTAVTTGTAQAVWIMNPTAVTATVTVSQPFGDAIAFSFTTVSAPTVITPALCNVAWLGTTVQTSMYVVPAGRRLQIQAVVCRVQNTAASIGFGRVEVEVRASLSSSVTVGPVILFGQAVSPTSGTNAANAEVYDVRMDVSTTMSVGFAYKASGGTGHLVGFVIQGVLY